MPIFQALLGYSLPHLLLRRRMRRLLSACCADMLSPAPVTSADPYLLCCAAAAAARGPTPSEARSLQWLAFAAACLGHSPARLTSSEKSQFPAAAAGLAGLIPYAVLAEDVQLQWLHSAVAPGHQMEALNGAVVGLCSAMPRHEGPTSQAADLPHCQGVGVVRTADAGSSQLLVLTPLQDQELQEVDVLQVGLGPSADPLFVMCGTVHDHYKVRADQCHAVCRSAG